MQRIRLSTAKAQPITVSAWRCGASPEAIVRNEHSVLPITSMIYGHYGVDGICLGVPTIVGRNGAEAVLDIPLSEEELAQLQPFAEHNARDDRQAGRIIQRDRANALSPVLYAYF